MTVTRRLTFQLTPLLDLLLIVIFAQYMEMSQSTAQVEVEIRQEADQKIERLQDERAELARELAANKRERAQLEMELRRRLENMADELELAVANWREIAELLSALFQIPKATLDEVLLQQPRSEADREQIRKLYEKLAEGRTNQAIKHLLAHRAMLKRVDVWELMIDEQGVVHLRAGAQEREFRFRPTPSEEAAQLKNIPLDEQVQRLREFERDAAERFANELFDAYQDLPQPKDIVVLLVSWKDALRHWRKPALRGLDEALRMLHRSREGVQFVPAIMGLEIPE